MTLLKRAIVDTLTYHGLFGFPMTAHEIKLALPRIGGTSHHGILLMLEELEREGAVATHHGLWHISGSEHDVNLRGQRYALAERKFAIARRFFRIARHTPFLRAVHVCNTLARSNAREESDIDLFIVTAPRRIWLTRLFVTGLAKLLHARPNHITSKDKLCLSFFITEDGLDLRTHAIENDVYLPHWLYDLYPIYDEAGIAGKLFAENAWARDRLPGLRKHVPSLRRLVRGGRSTFKTCLERLLDRDGLEAAAKSLQLRIMPKTLKAQAREGKGVVISDTVLKMHGLDRREEIRDRYAHAVTVVAHAAEEDRGHRSFGDGHIGEKHETENVSGYVRVS